MPSYQQIVDGLSDYPHKLFRVTEWRASSDSPDVDTREEVTELVDADVIVSKIDGRCEMHTIMLDLDCPHRYVESTTEGHGHLYIDVPVHWDDYKRLLQLLADLNVLQPGYVGASRKRGFTSLRLPWVRKVEEFTETEAAF